MQYRRAVWRLTALQFPPSCMLRSCFHVQLVSSCVERTNEMCTPSPRCTAEQSRQMKTPYVTDDHVGFFALQSKHTCQRHSAKSLSLNIHAATLRPSNDTNFICWNRPQSLKYCFNIVLRRPRVSHFRRVVKLSHKCQKNSI